MILSITIIAKSHRSIWRCPTFRTFNSCWSTSTSITFIKSYKIRL